MQSLCCWPPDRPSAESFSRSLTSSQSAARRRRLDALVEAVLQPERAGPEGHVVVDRLGEGLGFWKTMPIRRRTSTGSTFRA